ncbi:hypothetical protein Tco_0666704 [Tanacetum coccineum]
MEVAVKEAGTKNGAENKTKNKPIKKAEKEEAVEAPSSQPVEYYLKHKINEKLIERLVNNHRKKITRKEDMRGNFKIHCNIGGLKHINALVDQGSNEEKIKLHQEKEMEFDRWRNKNFKNERPAPVDGVDDEGEATLYLTTRSLKALRKFHWTILRGRFDQLSHISSPLLSKPGEY